MSETRSTNLIHNAELKALNEIERTSSPTKVETQGQIISRIQEINRSLRGFDLVVESQVFRELAKTTGVAIPHLVDRLLTSLDFLLKIENISNNLTANLNLALSKIFEWEPKLLAGVNEEIKIIEIYLGIKDIEKLSAFTVNLSKKYAFAADLFSQIEKLDGDSHEGIYEKIMFLKKIGPLIAITDAIRDARTEELDDFEIVLSLMKYVLDVLSLKSVHIADLIPNLIRSIARREGITEEESLKMHTADLQGFAIKSRVGTTLTKISYVLGEQEQSQIQIARIGKYIWTEFKDEGFWEKAEYLPKIAMLRGIASKPNLDLPTKTKKDKLSATSGQLRDLIYG